MKFSHAEAAGNLIRSYAPGYLQVNNTCYAESIILTVDTLSLWHVNDVAELSAAQFESLLAHRPDLVLLGTGQRQVFPSRAIFRPLAEAGVGVEVMATDAAARTFNVLTAEDRRVVAALIV